MFKDEVPHKLGKQQRRVPDVNGRLSHSLQLAVSRLLVARNYAEDAGRNVWDFAVTIAELRRDGVTENELRWLVCRGYVDHAEEITTSSNERTFNHRVSLRFSKRSAFVITSAGVTSGGGVVNGSAPREIRVDV